MAPPCFPGSPEFPLFHIPLAALPEIACPRFTGHFPFEGNSPVDIARKHLQEPLISPRKHVADIPPYACKIACKMMAKSPNERYQYFPDLIEDLTLALIGKDIVQQTADLIARHARLHGEQDGDSVTHAPNPGLGRSLLSLFHPNKS
jgi:serine/threonine protein kinase